MRYRASSRSSSASGSEVSTGRGGPSSWTSSRRPSTRCALSSPRGAGSEVIGGLLPERAGATPSPLLTRGRLELGEAPAQPRRDGARAAALRGDAALHARAVLVDQATGLAQLGRTADAGSRRLELVEQRVQALAGRHA